MLTGPPDFGLILAAGITACSLAGSLGRAREELRRFWGPRGYPIARTGSTKVGKGALLGAGSYFKSSVLCHQMKSLPLSEPQIDSAKFLQGPAWVV